MTTYIAELARSSRSKCRGCRETILKGTVRIGKVVDGESFQSKLWYHPCCFKIPKKKYGGDPATFLSEASIEFPEELTPAQLDELRNGLSESPQAALLSKKRKLLADASAQSPARDEKPKKKKQKQKKKKRKTKKSYAIEIEEDVASGESKRDWDKVPLVELKHSKALTFQRLHKMNKRQLSEMLTWNRQTKTGNKDELCMKILDGIMYGAIPTCPLCADKHSGVGTTIKVKYPEGPKDHGGQGTFTCSGYYNKDEGYRETCTFKAERMDRLPWVFNKEDSREAEAEQGASAGAATFDDVSLDLSALTSRKEIALAIRRCARNVGIMLPEDDTKANVACGMKYMACLQDDGSADIKEILALLKQEHGTTAGAAAKKKANADACGHPDNIPLVECFQELLRLMKLNGAAGFKLGAVRKAIVGMQSLDFKITDGVMLTKKKTKVQGIGKSTAAKIDEFLETGMISKVEDLRALLGEA